MKTKDIKTLNDLIRYSEVGKYTLPTVSLVEKFENVVIFEKLIYNDYEEKIKPYISTVILNEEEYNKYKYKPELLAYDLYGNQNLYHLLLFVNNCSEYEFDMHGIQVVEPTALETVIYKIISHEDERISNNKIY